MPEPSPLTTTQLALLRAVQGHSAGAATENVAVPPSFVKSAVDGDRSYVHVTGGRPSCVTVWVCVAIVMVPVRGLGVVFAATT
jgi:hypothetical protein